MITLRRLVALGVLIPAATFAQGTMADYQRAVSLQARYAPLVTDSPDLPVWIGSTDRFWYRKTVKGGDTAIVVVDANTVEKRAGTAADTMGTRPGRGGRGGGAGGAGGGGGRGGVAADATRPSPDGKLLAYIDNFNIAVRPAGSATGTPGTLLSTDGSEGNPYTFQSLVWSPNSKMIAAYRVRPGYRRMVRYVESSPTDQLQPKTFERYYQKPGDVLDLQQPSLFDVTTKHETVIDNALFDNPYDLSRIEWRKDSRAFTFEYNQRGHQLYRVIEVSASTGTARALVTETSKTFVDYRRANVGLADSGRQFRYDLDDGRESIWMSERDGWAHLYMIDGTTGAVKSQITKGNWLVRGVQYVDEANKQIIFAAGGMNPKQDPYFLQYYRINFDGT
ncbi:MAG TPA: DPP IV N-terminal domain-containing protein, partial [Gemmatimonadaceae bacterium]